MRTLARRAAAVVTVAAAGLAFAAPARAAAPVPASMDALGDSITRAVNSCSFNDCPVGSWATGTRPDVDSIARRLTAWNPAFVAYNDAKSGAEMDDLVRQARLAVGRGAELVTLLLGANDACNPTVAQMTPVATYRAELDAGLQILRDGLPQARILVLSVPDIHQLWRVGRDDVNARNIWDAANICQSMLRDPLSEAPSAQTRRATVLQRVRDYNAQLEAGCAALNAPAFPDRCTYDGGAVFDTKFTLDMVSGIDFFHPSVAGQAALAAGAWERGVRFQPPPAPPAPPTPDVPAVPGPGPVAPARALRPWRSSRARSSPPAAGGRERG